MRVASSIIFDHGEHKWKIVRIVPTLSNFLNLTPCAQALLLAESGNSFSDAMERGEGSMLPVKPERCTYINAITMPLLNYPIYVNKYN